MDNYISTNDILKIISDYCRKNHVSLSRYARTAGVSKAWLSRLFHEKNKKISLLLAEQLLGVAGYSLRITKEGSIITSSRLRKKYE